MVMAISCGQVKRIKIISENSEPPTSKLANVYCFILG